MSGGGKCQFYTTTNNKLAPLSKCANTAKYLPLGSLLCPLRVNYTLPPAYEDLIQPNFSLYVRLLEPNLQPLIPPTKFFTDLFRGFNERLNQTLLNFWLSHSGFGPRHIDCRYNFSSVIKHWNGDGCGVV